uniref:Secreted protein n=1 Tax=Triticum urartu TaxID=4572 RepID=A0A8R7V6S4_TRIUA
MSRLLMPWSRMLLAKTVQAVVCDHSHTVRVPRYHAAALLAAAFRACIAPERLAAARSRLPSQTDTMRFCAAPLCSCW